MRSRSERDAAEVVHVRAMWNFDPVIALKNIASQFKMPFISGRSI
jgi:hypothetical protein